MLNIRMGSLAKLWLDPSSHMQLADSERGHVYCCFKARFKSWSSYAYMHTLQGRPTEPPMREQLRRLPLHSEQKVARRCYTCISFVNHLVTHIHATMLTIQHEVNMHTSGGRLPSAIGTEDRRLQARRK
jgi:hypothetical protein